MVPFFALAFTRSASRLFIAGSVDVCACSDSSVEKHEPSCSSKAPSFPLSSASSSSAPAALVSPPFTRLSAPFGPAAAAAASL